MIKNQHTATAITLRRDMPDTDDRNGREERSVEWDGTMFSVGCGEYGPAVISPDRVQALIDDMQTVLKAPEALGAATTK